ncbi:DUF2790 domain-containing protein [Pseudomonas sp. Z3-8]|uniref:DUF2790 domain-containing protein n=1 Tax=Pseudomonas sp. Z3-8 TaxID=2817412 RepID=UPI003DA7AA73
MYLKNLSLASLFAVLSLGALTANAQDSVKPHTYMYGDHLDIAKVLSVKQGAGSGCGVVESRMTYLDSTGTIRALDYSALAQGCDQDN